MIRAVIADDEPLARAGIRDLLAVHPDVQVVAECRSGRELAQLLRDRRVDLLFLDIHMPEGSGFEALEALPPAERPLVIFITAYDEHALHAFQVSAVDYLTKPVIPARFAAALERARALLQYGDRRHVMTQLERVAEALTRPPTRILLKADGRSQVVAPAEMVRVEAAGNYAKVHLRNGFLLVRETMAELEQRLPGHQFLRTHRSHIVNIAHIREIQPLAKGEHIVIMHSGETVPLSRKYREVVERHFGRQV